MAGLTTFRRGLLVPQNGKTATALNQVRRSFCTCSQILLIIFIQQQMVFITVNQF